MTVSYIVKLLYKKKTSRDYLQSLRSYEISSSNTTWINQSHAKTPKAASSWARNLWDVIHGMAMIEIKGGTAELMKVDVAKDMMWWLMTFGPHFHQFSWVVEEILFEFSYCWNLRSATQRSQLRRDRETATLPPPMLWFVPKLSKQIKMNSGVVLRICCFPIFSLQTRLNNKILRSTQTQTTQGKLWLGKMILQLPEGRDLFQTGCVGTGGDFEDCMNRRTRPLHCEVMIQRHMKICKLSSQTNSNNEGSNFPAVRLEKLPTKFVSNSPNPTLIILTSTSLGTATLHPTAGRFGDNYGLWQSSSAASEANKKRVPKYH